MKYPINAIYRFWISEFLGTAISCIGVRKLNSDGTPSIPGASDKIIGDISVGELIKNKPEIFDVRRYPGIINRKLLETQPELLNYFDVGYLDGKPYQGNAVIIVKIPLFVKARIRNMLFDRMLQTLEITNELRGIVDARFTLSGRYEIESLVSEYGLSETEYDTMIDYAEYISRCEREAEDIISDVVKKHIGFGVYPIIIYKLDER